MEFFFCFPLADFPANRAYIAQTYYFIIIYIYILPESIYYYLATHNNYVLKPRPIRLRRLIIPMWISVVPDYRHPALVTLITAPSTRLPIIRVYNNNNHDHMQSGYNFFCLRLHFLPFRILKQLKPYMHTSTIIHWYLHLKNLHFFLSHEISLSNLIRPPPSQLTSSMYL